MNEIELQKLLIKEAFTKSKPMPDFGGLGDENTLKLRNYIWKVCGCLDQETVKKGQQATAANIHVKTSKKNALVQLYRLWSAFTKNIRYIIDVKGNAVTLQRFGTFTRSGDDLLSVAFIPSSELVSSLNASKSSQQSTGECVGAEW